MVDFKVDVRVNRLAKIAAWSFFWAFRWVLPRAWTKGIYNRIYVLGLRVGPGKTRIRHAKKGKIVG